jgi:hypothetical protein
VKNLSHGIGSFACIQVDKTVLPLAQRELLRCRLRAVDFSKITQKFPIMVWFAHFSMHSVQKNYINIVKNLVLTDGGKSSKI